MEKFKIEKYKRRKERSKRLIQRRTQLTKITMAYDTYSNKELAKVLSDTAYKLDDLQIQHDLQIEEAERRNKEEIFIE